MNVEEFRALSPEERERVAFRCYEVAAPFLRDADLKYVRDKEVALARGRKPLEKTKRRTNSILFD